MSLINYRTSHNSEGYGKHYDKTYSEGYYKYQWEKLEKPLLENILENLNEKIENTKSLDFACGTGRILKSHEKFFDYSHGVDVSESMIEIARSRCENSKIFKQDITREPLSELFDVITAFRFFLNAEDDLRREVLSSLHENLNDSGYLVVNIHVNSRSILGLTYRLRNKLLKRKVANTYAYEEFERALNEMGFKIENSYWYSYWPRIGGKLNKLSKRMLPVTDKVWKYLRLPKTLSQSYILVCKKK